MAAIKKTSLKLMLYVAFGVVVAIFIATSAVQVIHNLENRRATGDIRSVYLPHTASAMGVTTSLNTLVRWTLDGAIRKDEKALDFAEGLHATIRTELKNLLLDGKKAGRLNAVAQVDRLGSDIDDLFGLAFKVVEVYTGEDGDDLDLLSEFTGFADEIIESSAGLADGEREEVLLVANFLQDAFDRSTIILIVAVGIALVTGLGGALVLSAIMSIRLKKIELVALNIQKGDFSQTVDVDARDEIGTLGHAFNAFLTVMRDIVAGIRSISLQTDLIKNDLSVGSDETVESLVGVTTTTEIVSSRVELLYENIGSSSVAIGQIAQTIETLKDQIEAQTSAVVQSTAAVEQMIASLTSVSSTIQSKKESTDRLNLRAKSGGEKVDATNHIIQLVLGDADSIMNMVSIINSVSAQTNVLSINAAIEGAHAGVNGRGFAVIAEEIKKLAESTSENSKSISAVLEGTVQKMRDASSSGLEMKDAFVDIEDDVVEVAKAFDEILNSAVELSTGGEEILRATSELSKGQESIREGALEITNSAGAVSSSIAKVKSISGEVADSMGEIEETVTSITQVIINVADASEKLQEVVAKLNAEMARFKIDSEAGVT
jgi:methyl-accepting chemotaxis protein